MADQWVDGSDENEKTEKITHVKWQLASRSIERDIRSRSIIALSKLGLNGAILLLSNNEAPEGVIESLELNTGQTSIKPIMDR